MEPKKQTTIPAEGKEDILNDQRTDMEAEVKVDKPKYNKDELLAIFDELIFSGEYREDLTIKGRLKVTFKTRTAEETSEITQAMDTKAFSLISSVQEFRALQNLSYSLVRYNGKDIGISTKEERLKFIGKLPAVMVGALSEALVDFDAKTDAACREGEQNF